MTVVAQFAMPLGLDDSPGPAELAAIEAAVDYDHWERARAAGWTRLCRCTRWPIALADADGEDRCLKCGRGTGRSTCEDDERNRRDARHAQTLIRARLKLLGVDYIGLPDDVLAELVATPLRNVVAALRGQGYSLRTIGGAS